ncbi:hypothetical protein UFOVP328_318 [uncultured Caudovirales phage]|uniref:Uncharacterized protein n=1 Tax=uncultured Caudovirales phage TaxID=2100421 RepID=A0A6J5LUI9_9CAUD|nr:hypothetical protein UFOVP328_318 [uncultured Caudovirales phage]
MILYCNSDSYGVCSDTDMRYSEFLGELLNVDHVINNGLGGACNRRILRTTVRDLLELKAQHPEQDILAVICLGSLIRNEWWNPDAVPGTNNDGHYQSFQIHGTDYKNQPFVRYANEWYRLYDDEAEQTNLLMELTLLTGWLELNQIKYIMFAGNSLTYKKLDYSDVFIRDFANNIFSNPRILNINDFSFVKYCIDRGHHPYDYDLWMNNGHHGESAHKDFAGFLYKFYNKIYT